MVKSDGLYMTANGTEYMVILSKILHLNPTLICSTQIACELY